MAKPVVLVGALDTKGAEFAFVRDLIQAQGVETVVVDFGVLDDPFFTLDVTNDAVVRAGGSTIADLRSQADEFLTTPVTSADLVGHVTRLATKAREARP